MRLGYPIAMSLGLPSKIKYINMRNQKHERVFASDVRTRQLIDVTLLDLIDDASKQYTRPDPAEPTEDLGESR